jgi:hypothetical protein
VDKVTSCLAMKATSTHHLNVKVPIVAIEQENQLNQVSTGLGGKSQYTGELCE